MDTVDKPDGLDCDELGQTGGAYGSVDKVYCLAVANTSLFRSVYREKDFRINRREAP